MAADESERYKRADELLADMEAAFKRLVEHYAREIQTLDLSDYLSGTRPLVEIHCDPLRCLVARFPDGLNALTPREREIAILVSEALPNKVIANKLGIKSPTVAAHLRRIYEKCGVDSRTGLATMMIGRS